MNKEQYANVLERELKRENEENRTKAQKSSLYKSIEKSLSKLDNQISTLRRKRDKLVPPYSWSETNTKVEDFRTEWDNMSLIGETKKKDSAKIKLLKKYKLYR